MLTGTKNFTVGEALRASQGAIPAELQDNAQACLEWLQAVRDYLGLPIIITCLYRSRAHNAELAGSASNSPHLVACALDFDVVGLSNHSALLRILTGVDAGAIPPFSQIITYTTDHHLHARLALAPYGADQQTLIETAVGQYADLDVQTLATLAGDHLETARQIVGQAADVAGLHPVVTALVAAFFIAPALLGGHWT